MCMIRSVIIPATTAASRAVPIFARPTTIGRLATLVSWQGRWLPHFGERPGAWPFGIGSALKTKDRATN
jgi:hypothetical protein